MAFDEALGRVVLFGGEGLTAPYGTYVSNQDDTWAWNGYRWEQLQPATHPSARFGSSLAYFPPTRQLVLFGGRTDGRQTLGDTWLYGP